MLLNEETKRRTYRQEENIRLVWYEADKRNIYTLENMIRELILHQHPLWDPIAKHIFNGAPTP